jgi:transcriptional regulator with XRE-family HTH domain
MGSAQGVGTALRSARTARGMSLNDVASAAGISAATLSRIETEKQGVDVGLLMSIAGILHVAPADILATDDERSHTAERLADALAALPSAERAKVIAAASRRRQSRKASEQLQAQLETLLVTVDLIRDELTELHRETQRRAR